MYLADRIQNRWIKRGIWRVETVRLTRGHNWISQKESLSIVSNDIRPTDNLILEIKWIHLRGQISLASVMMTSHWENRGNCCDLRSEEFDYLELNESLESTPSTNCRNSVERSDLFLSSPTIPDCKYRKCTVFWSETRLHLYENNNIAISDCVVRWIDSHVQHRRVLHLNTGRNVSRSIFGTCLESWHGRSDELNWIGFALLCTHDCIEMMFRSEWRNGQIPKFSLNFHLL
jgi:hypothetical protein